MSDKFSFNKNITYKTNKLAKFFSNNRLTFDDFYKSEKVMLETIDWFENISVLDVGCGWNEWKHLAPITWVRNHHLWPDKDLVAMSKINIVGVDIACPGADVIAPAHNMPLQDKCVDLLVSFDCMEHIPEEEVSKSILEFARVAHRCYVNVCLADSPTTIDDEPLHVCIKPRDWWVEKFKEHWPSVVVVKEHGQDTPHWTITIVAANVPINE